MNLTQKKETCCGCGACVGACPKQAIRMETDEHGFVYPVISDTLCVNCGKCYQICALKSSELGNTPLECYAGITAVTDIRQSSSGGVFAALASAVLDEGGVVFGAALEMRGEAWAAEHIAVTSKAELPRVLGSKYVQSRTTDVFPLIRDAVKAGKKVLFSGTPCQCDAVRSYLGKDCDKILVVDIVCHGVPNEAFFNGYMHILQQSFQGKITDFRFRDKKRGWQYKTARAASEKKTRYLFPNEASYLSLFERGMIVRPSCHACKYACASRVGDITLADYWGVSSQMPQLFSGENGWSLTNGVSAVIVNTERGREALKAFSDSVQLRATTFMSIARKNDKLSHPTPCPAAREDLMRLYAENGYDAVHGWWKKHGGRKRLTRWLKNRIPTGIRQRCARLKR